MDKYDYNPESFIRKRHEPVKIPGYLRLLIIIENKINITNNVINKSNALRISEPSGVEDFLEINYKRGGMYPLVEMKRHPEWRPRYRYVIITERVNICKSCKQKSAKNCCSEYSQKNRSKVTMVIGWH
jgi:hypothetical protein